MRIAANSINVQQHGKKVAQGGAQKKSWSDQIKNLKEQQEILTKKRAELLAENKEQGGDMELIKEQLKGYDMQLKALDEQMQNIMTEQMKEQKEKLGKKEGNASDNTNKTEEQLQDEKLTRLATLSGRLDHMAQISNTKDQTEQDSRISDAQIKTDNTNRTELLERIALTNPEVAKYMDKIGATDRAYSDLSALKEKISTLSESLSSGLNDLQQDVTEEGKRPDDIGDKEQTDSVTGKDNKNDKTDETVGEEDNRSELEKALDLTDEFTDQYGKWSKEALEQNLSAKDANNYVLDRIAQWTAQLYERNDDSLQRWNRLITPLDARA